MHCRLLQQISSHKKADDLSADSLILTCKIIFSGFGLPKVIMLDTGDNFVSDKFEQISNTLNIEQGTSSSYHAQSNLQVEACIKIIKCSIKSGLILKETYI